MSDNHDYWRFRDEFMKHPAGRAAGGEPCVRCSNPVPANAAWQYRDRHVCGKRCNVNLARDFTRRVARGEIILPDDPLSDPLEDSGPVLFPSVEVDGGWTYVFEGLGPRPGDIVERHGVYTVYQYWPPSVLPAEFASSIPNGVHVAVHESGVVHLTAMTEDRRPGRMTLGTFMPHGTRNPNHRFSHNDVNYRFVREFIRDITEDGRDYTWEAIVCLPEGADHPGTVWTLRFIERSQSRLRASRSRGSHLRRVRLQSGRVETFDPLEIYERDQWKCGICHERVDASVAWPDAASASLDHIVPLASGGDHTRVNTQLAHLVCNLRKGVRPHPL